MTGRIENPEAFFDTNGVLRNWDTTDPMPDSWNGIAKRNDTFFVVGRDGRERTYTALFARTFFDAQAEAVTRCLVASKPASLLPKDIAAMYASRDAFIAEVASRGSVDPGDLVPLERSGRCIIASQYWSICSEPARRALREDPHHFVRACAVMSEHAHTGTN